MLDLGIRQIPVGRATLAKRLQTGAWRPLADESPERLFDHDERPQSREEASCARVS